MIVRSEPAQSSPGGFVSAPRCVARPVLALTAALLFAACEQASGPITEDPAVAEIVLDATALGSDSLNPSSLFVGETVELTATLVDGQGRTVSGGDIRWASSSVSVATVDALGVLTAVGAGTATVTASHGTLSAGVEVVVVQVGSVEVTPPMATLVEGDSVHLQAIALAADGTQIVGARIEWEGSAPEVASVDNGFVRALSAGTAVIVASAGNRHGEATVEVTTEDPVQTPSERSVLFRVKAKTDFVPWMESPTLEEQAWMREHYHRMTVWTPYFDSRLAWYPNALVYKDAYAIKPEWDVFAEHPDWILKDSNGRLLFIPWGCSGGTCPQYAADFGNPAFRQWWIDGATEDLARGYIGLHIDDVNLEWRVSDGNEEHVKPIDPRTGAEMTLSDWRRYFAEFMEDVRAAFPTVEITHNSIWFAQPEDDPFILRQIAAANRINLERGATDRGIRGGGGQYGYQTFLGFIDRVHSMGGSVVLDDDDSDTTVERDYELATYFLIKAEGDMIGADGDRSRMTPDSFWEGYDIVMGDALGPRAFVDGVFRRDFQCGTVLLNQPEMSQRTVNVGEGFTRLDGTPVTSVTLPAAAAAILLRDVCVLSP